MASLRAAHGGRPLLLTTPGSVNWRTGGLSDPIDLSAGIDPVWALDCDAGGVLITTEIEAPRLEYDYRVRDLGWDLEVVPWFEGAAPLAAALGYANVKVDDLLSDRDDFGENVRDALVLARLVLSECEREELRELGSLVGAALGAGVDAWRPGVSRDYELAAVVSSHLEAGGAKAVCLIVGGDERVRLLRHPLAVGAIVSDVVMAVVVAKRAGLHAAATRLCVRRGDDEIVALTEALGSVNDAVMASSRPGGSWGEATLALVQGYEAIGHGSSWREHYQGGPIGFEQREFELAPGHADSPFWAAPCESGTAVAWNPSLRGGAKIEETYLVGEEFELLTATPGWPLVEGAYGARRSALRVLP